MSHQLNLSARALAIAGALGALIAVTAAVLMPSTGVGGTTSTVPTPTCNGEEADIVILKPTGSEPVIGTDGRDVIVGSNGDDTIRGTKGNDLICGQFGDDQINGGQGRDELRGDGGEDLLRGRTQGDTLVGGGIQQDTKRKRGIDIDRCFGGYPVPDTGPQGDTASQCEDVKNARIIDIEN